MNETNLLTEKVQALDLNKQKATSPQKKLYEVATSIGKLTIQITKFTQYIIIVVTYSGALKLDGYLQIAYPTPYSQRPSVLNLQKEEGQMDNQKLIQLLSKQLKVPIFLSFNLDDLNKGSEQQLFHVLKKILIPQKQKITEK